MRLRVRSGSVGSEEARRAFNEDERWKSGPTYLFVAEVAPLDQARLFVFPPDPSREGSTLGVRIDVFGNNFREERNRIVTSFGEGWSYYAFRNPATGREEPKASYVKGIDDAANLYHAFASGVRDKINGYLLDKPLLLIGEGGANLINRSTPIAFMAQGKY